MRAPSGKAYYVYGSVIYAIYIKYQNNIYLYGQIIGFTVMDKQLLLTEMRLTRCRLMTYIVNAVLCWQHFSRLVPAVPGLERWAWEHAFRPSCVQWLRMI